MAKNIEEIRAALASYGITGVKDIYYNPSYEQLFKDEMDPALTGYDKRRRQRDDRHLHRPLAQGQIYRYGCQVEGHRLVDHRGLQERQPPDERRSLEAG